MWGVWNSTIRVPYPQPPNVYYGRYQVLKSPLPRTSRTDLGSKITLRNPSSNSGLLKNVRGNHPRKAQSPVLGGAPPRAPEDINTQSRIAIFSALMWRLRDAANTNTDNKRNTIWSYHDMHIYWSDSWNRAVVSVVPLDY